jgi:hypothetical protein
MSRNAASDAAEPRTAAATEARAQYAAERAVDDPRRLAQAARIVRAALARKALEPTDLLEGGPDAA